MHWLLFHYRFRIVILGRPRSFLIPIPSYLVALVLLKGDFLIPPPTTPTLFRSRWRARRRVGRYGAGGNGTRSSAGGHWSLAQWLSNHVVRYVEQQHEHETTKARWQIRRKHGSAEGFRTSSLWRAYLHFGIALCDPHRL